MEYKKCATGFPVAFFVPGLQKQIMLAQSGTYVIE